MQVVVYVALDVLHVVLLAQCAAVGGFVGHVVALDGREASSWDSVGSVGYCLAWSARCDGEDDSERRDEAH